MSSILDTEYVSRGYLHPTHPAHRLYRERADFENTMPLLEKHGLTF